ncbi:MAG TPA: hypothetical protein VGA49_03680 [Patescibacteria group bacterium]
MLLLKRILPVLTPTAVFLGFEYIFVNADSFWRVVVLIYILLILSVIIIVYNKITLSAAWVYLINPILLVSSALLFVILLESSLLRHLILAATVLILGSILNNIFIYLHQTHRYQAYSFESLIDYSNLIVAFLFFSSFYFLTIFLNILIWQLFILAFIIIALLSYQLIWSNKIDLKRGAVYVFINSLVLSQLFWAISFLPIGYLASGLILTLIFYMISGMSKLTLLDRFSLRKSGKYLIIGFLGIIVVLATTRWL